MPGYALQQHKAPSTWEVLRNDRRLAIVTPTVDGRWQVQFTDYYYAEHCPSWVVDKLEDSPHGIAAAMEQAAKAYQKAEAARRKWAAGLTVGDLVWAVPSVARRRDNPQWEGFIQSAWATRPGAPDAWLVAPRTSGKDDARKMVFTHNGISIDFCWELYPKRQVRPSWMDL